MSEAIWSVTEDGYLHAQGASVLAWHNAYPQGKQGGIELIHHGERVATCGGMRVSLTSGRSAGWPRAGERTADPEAVELSVPLEFRSADLKHQVRLTAEGGSIRVSLELPAPLDPDEVREASFCIDLYPPAYFGRTFHAERGSGVFPRDAGHAVARTAEGGVKLAPLAEGPRLVIAPEDAGQKLTIEGLGCQVALTDGRATFEEAWFTVSSPVPLGRAGILIEWLLTPHLIPGWRRAPVICVSQVGYHPDQAKRAVIELDTAWQESTGAALFRVDSERGETEVLSGPVAPWGRFLRHGYGIFDFTGVREPGLYIVRYAGESAGPFRIHPAVYREGTWQPTLTRFFPVQMCHTRVSCGGRLWHAACHLDDALQAPAPHEHFDGYRQGAATDTPFSPHEHIPHLDAGGWHDAGDTDLAAGSQARTVHALALAREAFGAACDETTVLPRERIARIGVPDGVPDIVQQIAHGVQCLLGGYRACGHSFCGIIASRAEAYYQRGEVSRMTDNLVYDPQLAEEEARDGRSGEMDDRWAFTNRDTSLEYQVAAALAAAARVLKGHEDELAAECLDTAEAAWQFEQSHPPAEHRSGYVPRRPECQEVIAAAELLIATGKPLYRDRLLELLPVIRENARRVGWAAARVAPELADPAFADGLREALVSYRDELSNELAENPFGVLYRPHIWGVAWDILHFALAHYYLVRAYPDLFDREAVLAVVNYVLGCHPGSNVSLVSGVGRRSQTVAFGINRADWSYVPGGVISGPNLIRPDFPELKDGFPFIWQQSEYVMPGAGSYIFCVLAADALLNTGG